METMTQEDKDLLLKDLCARLPYDVKCYDEAQKETGIFNHFEYEGFGRIHNGRGVRFIENIKPYLFPLSSMNEEQKEEYHYIVNYISPDDTENWAEGEFVYVNQIEQLLHFYHTNHLDYRGLISKDLALDATGKNIY